jgi:hypothetical protein
MIPAGVRDSEARAPGVDARRCAEEGCATDVDDDPVPGTCPCAPVTSVSGFPEEGITDH